MTTEDLKWKRIRAGWYVAEQVPGLYFHIRRVNDRKPKWGWDCFTSDDAHTFHRHRMLHGGLADLHEAKNVCGEKAALFANDRVAWTA